jgi:hypothetical protein
MILITIFSLSCKKENVTPKKKYLYVNGVNCETNKPFSTKFEMVEDNFTLTQKDTYGIFESNKRKLFVTGCNLSFYIE